MVWWLSTHVFHLFWSDHVAIVEIFEQFYDWILRFQIRLQGENNGLPTSIQIISRSSKNIQAYTHYSGSLDALLAFSILLNFIDTKEVLDQLSILIDSSKINFMFPFESFKILEIPEFL